ncbi:MAG: TIGR02186 family protein [Kiloniellales bacterium]|nr:TIGR02186 family protein [Kiloniellales bacterium]
MSRAAKSGLVAALTLAALLAAAWLATGRAQSPLVADLSKHLVAITTGFAGTDVLLFGAIDEPGDVIVLVRGPSGPVTMHRKSRIAGIWINTASMTFDEAPAFFAVAASRPLEAIASEVVLKRNDILIDDSDVIRLAPAKASANIANDWRQALIRNKQRSNLYPLEAGRVDFLGAQLFRTDVFFPANVPTGTYQVQVFLLRDGAVVSAQTTPLIVSKIGVEAEIFDFAHQQSALYGLIAILVALVAGWLAHIAFRKS